MRVCRSHLELGGLCLLLLSILHKKANAQCEIKVKGSQPAVSDYRKIYWHYDYCRTNRDPLELEFLVKGISWGSSTRRGYLVIVDSVSNDSNRFDCSESEWPEDVCSFSYNLTNDFNLKFESYLRTIYIEVLEREACSLQIRLEEDADGYCEEIDYTVTFTDKPHFNAHSLEVQVTAGFPAASSFFVSCGDHFSEIVSMTHSLSGVATVLIPNQILASTNVCTVNVSNSHQQSERVVTVPSITLSTTTPSQIPSTDSLVDQCRFSKNLAIGLGVAFGVLSMITLLILLIFLLRKFRRSANNNSFQEPGNAKMHEQNGIYRSNSDHSLPNGDVPLHPNGDVYSNTFETSELRSQFAPSTPQDNTTATSIEPPTRDTEVDGASPDAAAAGAEPDSGAAGIAQPEEETDGGKPDDLTQHPPSENT